MRAGVTFSDWRVMSRWQVKDFLAHHKIATHEAMQGIKEHELGGVLAAVVSRILGV